MITKPLLTGIVYLYLYDYMVASRSDRDIPKSGMELFIMGSVGELLIRYL